MLGIVLQCVGALLIAIATLGVLSIGIGSSSEGFLWRIAGALVSAVVGVTGGYAYRLGASHRARSAHALTSIDPRPAVVYLRSFLDDPMMAKGFVPHASLPFLEFLNTEEEDLAQVMNQIGPFLAVGRPGERLPQTGAARMYLTHSEWQTRVLELISAARLVVIRAGYTQGVWWEVETAVRVVKPERLLFLLPFNASQYEAFRLKAAAYLPCKLPDYRPGNKRLARLASVHGFLYFEPNWTPHYLDLKPLRVLSFRPVPALFKLTLQPVFKQLGVPWKSPGHWQIPLLISLVLIYLVIQFLKFVGIRL